ncbi:MAG TPA: iron ABC transporter permease [Intrasporangium sp.]|uniref:ABC transporter permease n=1 Tax=Intrasporangium sp. TaxID=1925024 RepID=UPI002D785E13|nr:iron ABC transporter permease [Intrasporangium sp.]HET7399646.1 iron ABC transporter permease [Intrasporangium sp.]
MGRPARDAPRSAPAPLRAAALLVAALCTLPLVVVVVGAADAGAAQVAQVLWRPRVAELLANSTALVVLTVAVTTAVGVGAAWLVERTTLAAAGFWRVALVCPLAVPAFVNSYAWISVWPQLEGLAGAVVVTSLSYFPFVFLPVSAVLRGLDPGLEDTARALGLGPWRAFGRAVLPQLRPAVLGGMLLVALHLLSEFGVLAMLRFPTFTTAILEQYQVAFNSTAGSLLACLLMTIALGLLTAELLLRGTARHARVARGSARRQVLAPLGRTAPLAVAALAALTLLSLGVPAVSLARWLLAGGADAEAASLARTLWGTVRLGLVAALLATVAAFPIAWLVARSRTWLAVAAERAIYVASSLPGVVVALALVTLAVRFARPLYQTSVVLVIAYTVLFLPRATVAIRAAIAHAPPELAETARSLGDGPLRTFVRVQLPLTLRGVLAGFALVFIAVATELTATLLLAPTGTETLATAFWSASESLDYAGAAPYAAAMVLVSAPVTYLLLRRGEEEQLP